MFVPADARRHRVGLQCHRLGSVARSAGSPGSPGGSHRAACVPAPRLGYRDPDRSDRAGRAHRRVDLRERPRRYPQPQAHCLGKCSCARRVRGRRYLAAFNRSEPHARPPVRPRPRRDGEVHRRRGRLFVRCPVCANGARRLDRASARGRRARRRRSRHCRPAEPRQHLRRSGPHHGSPVRSR